MPAKKPPLRLKAIEPFHWGDRTLVKDEEVKPGDPVVKGREHLFYEFTVESATAAPGEARNVRIPYVPTKKRPVKKAT